jgi:uroporphyrin-III C-methyltransferase / precorrin-2 dehydrogenase / sirohydrochlorin ferrochelatase
VALYMAGARHAATAAALIELGHAEQTPVAIIEDGTLASQRVSRTTLAELADTSTTLEIGSPALLIVGHVVEAARSLEWRTSPPRPDSTREQGVV